MAYELLQSLIDKRDNLEIVRDQVALILLLELANQQQKALAVGKDPQEWKLRIFTERGNCWGDFTSDDSGDSDTERPAVDLTPIVSVWVNKATYDRARSLPVVRQQADASLVVDIYGGGIARSKDGGHATAELQASNEVLRAYRLVRNILMSGNASNLAMPGVVGDHWPTEFETVSQPNEDLDKPKFERVAMGRLQLSVSFLEFAPEYVGEPLETLAVGVKRRETGELYFTANIITGV
jgi:hypothetical protein